MSPKTELEMLEKLADEILSLERLAVLAGDTADRLFINQLASHFRWMMDDLSSVPGVLDGDLPWWKNWQRRPA